jgi:hypothetical protein
MRQKQKNTRNSNIISSVIPGLALISFVALILFLIRNTTPLDIYFLEDTSLSARDSKQFVGLRNSICENIFVKGKTNNNFIHMVYADEVNTMGNWTKKRNCPLDILDPSQIKGTNPQKVIERALKEVEKRTAKQTKPVILLSIHADEQHDSEINRQNLISSIRSLAKKVSEKKGKMIFLANSYNSLRTTIENETANHSAISYCPYEKIIASQHPCSAETIFK